jgi:putative DNA primase/helicase
MKQSENNGIIYQDHHTILKELLNQIKPVDFRDEVATSSGSVNKLEKKHYVVTCIDQILNAAKESHWGLCKKDENIYLFNGAFWKLISQIELETFLGEAALLMGVDKYDARHFLFREQLLKQFHTVAHMPPPSRNKDTVLINLKNGTFETGPGGQKLRPPHREDFITYQLPFEYDPKASAPVFQAFLDRVLPSKDCQAALIEFIGYLFIRSRTLKLEKVLMLLGDGANGKSVFFEVIAALLGPENISHYSLNSLASDNGYARAMIGNKLLNYASEIGGKIQPHMFKQLASGEPIEARLPYGNPFLMTDYSKLAFNCNRLPSDVEHVHGFFRRFMIIPFSVTIPEAEQDKGLSVRIIESELPGVFNLVLAGLSRLLQNNAFTASAIIDGQLSDYKKQSDSVQLFIEDEGYRPDGIICTELKELFRVYRSYCSDNMYHCCSKRTFGERLRAAGFIFERKAYGMAVFAKKHEVF